MTLRRMVEADLSAVVRVERAAFAHPWSEELFARELVHEWSTILLSEEPEGIAGFLIYWLVHDEIHILNIATHPDARRKGVARALLNACFEEARPLGAALATLEVRRSNLPAIRLYESLGFRHVGVRPKYYEAENEDAFVMTLDFGVSSF